MPPTHSNATSYIQLEKIMEFSGHTLFDQNLINLFEITAEFVGKKVCEINFEPP